jgi:hypothetical protein
MAKNSIPFLVVLQTLLVFAVGVLGNKLADHLQIPPMLVLLLSVLLLGFLSALSLPPRTLRESDKPIGEPILHSASASAEQTRARVTPFPRTLLGAFPTGLLSGLLLAAALGATGVLRQVQWAPFGPTIYGEELASIIIGIVICLYIAVELDKFLAFAFGLGHAVGTATTLTLLWPDENNVALTYSGVLITFVAYGLLLILVAEPLGRGLRAMMNGLVAERG